MPAPRLSMRKIREVLRLKHERGFSHRAVAQACSIGVGTVTLYLERSTTLGLGWPLPSRPRRRRAGGPVVPPGGAGAGAGQAGLRVDPPRTHTPRRDAAPAVAGIRPGSSSGLSLQPVLCDLPAVGPAAAAVDAPGASRRREDLHRLLGHTPGGGRSAHGRGTSRRALRRGARGQQLHLRRGDRNPAAARLGRGAHPDGRVLRGLDGPLGPRPAEEHHHAVLSLRAGHQSDV